MRSPRATLLLLLAVAVLQAGYYYPRLPDRIASHFDVAGRPNAASSKWEFLGVHVLMVGLLCAIFIALPAFIHRLPTALINLPRKDYWLAPERRTETLDRFRDQLTWVGCASILFTIAVLQLVFEFNLEEGKEFSASSIWILIGIFIVFLLAWTIRMLRGYSVPRDEGRPGQK